MGPDRASTSPPEPMTAQIIKRKFVELDAPRSSAAHEARERTHGRKQARLIEDAGVVRGVEIVCSCGETTIVELVVAPVTSGGKSA
jgi:hypothetical protein